MQHNISFHKYSAQNLDVLPYFGRLYMINHNDIQQLNITLIRSVLSLFSAHNKNKYRDSTFGVGNLIKLKRSFVLCLQC